MTHDGQHAQTMSIPQQLYRPEQVREHEAEAAARAGIDMWTLMQRAGAAAWSVLSDKLAPRARIAVLCGTGNNGGDGYIVAALAREAGHIVRVFALAEPKTTDARRAWSEWLERGGDVEPLADWADAEPDWVVDALLGTGLQQTLRGEICDCVESLNEAKVPVLALDIPTGLHADTGQPLGDAVRARATVTFVGVKRGLTTGQAAAYCGHVHFADLGIQREFRLLTEPSAWYLQPTLLQHSLVPRAATAHKGDAGHVVILGGAAGMAGAVRLAGTAALRTGAGKVTILCEPGQEVIVGQQPELMVRGLEAGRDEALSYLEHASVLIFGPGLGQRAWGRDWWDWYCARLQSSDIDPELTTVLDADALNALAQARPDISGRARWILTPHPGEAARLLECETQDVEKNRWLAAQTLQEQFGGIVVLKGRGSLICGQEGIAVCDRGTPAMATAGMGDVLAGMIGGLLAQRHGMALATEAGVRLAVLAHALAGESAMQEKCPEGTRGLMASDIFDWIPYWMNPNDR